MSETKILSAQAVIDSSDAQLKQRIAQVQKSLGRPPGLAVVIVGNDPASKIYVSQKQKRSEQLGIFHQTLSLEENVAPDHVQALIEKLNLDSRVDGILIQRPLPKTFKEEAVSSWILPSKDVDAFHPENVGRLTLGRPHLVSCTPQGIMELLKFYKIPMSGKVACVVGRSNIVGKPMAALLLNEDASVIQCHSKTQDLARWTSQADLLIVAAGKPHLIRREHVRVGATVIDVGIHRNSQGKVMGDVDTESLLGHAFAVSPVPGGIGPMTIQHLMVNTILIAEKATT
jgi:methylenetetrahydrofolate dehydrogenase (NADP+)/methenyltetrahydrofolate cyclohydrolase